MFSPPACIDISGGPQNTFFFYGGAITNPAEIPVSRAIARESHYSLLAYIPCLIVAISNLEADFQTFRKALHSSGAKGTKNLSCIRIIYVSQLHPANVAGCTRASGAQAFLTNKVDIGLCRLPSQSLSSTSQPRGPSCQNIVR